MLDVLESVITAASIEYVATRVLSWYGFSKLLGLVPGAMQARACALRSRASAVFV